MHQNTDTHTHPRTQGPIVFLTSSLVYRSPSRLIPDFCLCSSSSSSSPPLCIKCPIIPLTKVTFSGGVEVTPFSTAGECQRAHAPHTALRTHTHAERQNVRLRAQKRREKTDERYKPGCLGFSLFKNVPPS